jgi:hypothetical protein
MMFAIIDIDGEAVVARDDGTPDFHALRSRRYLIEHDGDDLRVCRCSRASDGLPSCSQVPALGHPIR